LQNNIGAKAASKMLVKVTTGQHVALNFFYCFSFKTSNVARNKNDATYNCSNDNNSNSNNTTALLLEV